MIAVPVTMVHQFGEHGRLIRDSALSIHFILGAIITIYGSCYSLQQDMLNGTASSILSKPVSRMTYLSAKLAGVMGVVVLYSLIALMSAWIALGIAPRPFVIRWGVALLSLTIPCIALLSAAVFHFRFNRRFVVVAFCGIGFFQLALLLFLLKPVSNPMMAFRIDYRLIPALVLSACCLMMLSAFALTAATRLRASQTATLTFVLILTGLFSDYLIGPASAAPAASGVLYMLIPNWLHFWLADAISAGGHIPWSYVGHSALYAILYTAGLLLIARSLFTRMEMPTS